VATAYRTTQFSGKEHATLTVTSHHRLPPLLSSNGARGEGRGFSSRRSAIPSALALPRSHVGVRCNRCQKLSRIVRLGRCSTRYNSHLCVTGMRHSSPPYEMFHVLLDSSGSRWRSALAPAVMGRLHACVIKV
jgi:hypothetical protein